MDFLDKFLFLKLFCEGYRAINIILLYHTTLVCHFKNNCVHCIPWFLHCVQFFYEKKFWNVDHALNILYVCENFLHISPKMHQRIKISSASQ